MQNQIKNMKIIVLQKESIIGKMMEVTDNSYSYNLTHDIKHGYLCGRKYPIMSEPYIESVELTSGRFGAQQFVNVYDKFSDCVYRVMYSPGTVK